LTGELDCVGWGIKLYSLNSLKTGEFTHQLMNICACLIQASHNWWILKVLQLKTCQFTLAPQSEWTFSFLAHIRQNNSMKAVYVISSAEPAFHIRWL